MVGRLVRIPDLHESEQGWKSVSVILEVERPFANAKGIFEKDQVQIDVYRGAAETLAAVAQVNDWICARGRVQSRPHEKDGRVWLNYSFVAEKVEFLPR